MEDVNCKYLIVLAVFIKLDLDVSSCALLNNQLSFINTSDKAMGRQPNHLIVSYRVLVEYLHI